MSTTVLGKRLRRVADTVDVQTPSKKRITILSANDENENPFVLGTGRSGNVDARENELATEERIVKSSRSGARRAPVDCSSARSLSTTLSPSKLLSPRKRSRSNVDVYEDSSRERSSPPKTPRHRDAIHKVAVTPRHRVLATGDQLTPRSAKALGSPSHAATAVYNYARQIFARSSSSGKIIGRDNERAELSSFVQTRIASDAGGCLYVSGPPGTGKSALLGETIQEQTKKDNIKISVVNCMSIRNTRDLSQKLAEDLDLQEDAGFEYLQACFLQERSDSRQKYLVVLDEVDCLVDLDLSILYSLFEWSMSANSQLVLIGIANALDLTDRLLPRLKSRNLRPELLPFMPYTAAQIAEVLTTKLRSLTGDECQSIPFLHPAAIQFCAKKVAAQTGDLRKAFDICQRAIDLIAAETREKEDKSALPESPSKTPLMENCNLATSPSALTFKRSTQTIYTIETAPKATIAHMARVTAQVFSNGATQRLSNLNLQQKAVLCALAALEKQKRESQVQRAMFSTPSKTDTTAPSVKRLFETYSMLCKREKLFHALSSIEFRDVVSGLEALSLISAADGKAGSFATPLTPSRTPGRKSKNAFLGAAAVGDERRVASVVSVKEIESAIKGGPGGELLREMLEGSVL